MKTVLVLSLFLVVAIFGNPRSAAAAGPIGSCPPAFDLMAVMDHDPDPMHKHVGNASDRNGDGFICMKHVSASGNIHVHTDNNLPLR